MNKRLFKLIKATIACAAIGAIPCIADGMSITANATHASAHSAAYKR